MRGYDQYNFPAFDAAAQYLRAMGHEPVNPADLDREIGVDENTKVLPPNFIQDALRRDFYELTTCDAIAFLPGWEESSGARAERQVAEWIGNELYHIVPWVSFRREVAPLLVGMSGYAQVGKDTAGGMMVEDADFKRLAFADVLKTVALDVAPMMAAPAHGDYGDLATIVGDFGWEHAKRHYPDSRVFLQRLGVAIRQHVDPDAWVKAALRHVRPGGRYVITDVRFPNEAQAIKDAGGYIVRVTRPGVEAVNAHVSETALDGWDFDAFLVNNGTLADLRNRVHIFLGSL